MKQILFCFSKWFD